VPDPHAVFARAQAAMERGDWETFFGCLDRAELLVIARNGVKFLAASAPAVRSPLRSVLVDHAFPLDALDAQGRDIVQSAEAIVRDRDRPPAEQAHASLRHRELVQRYQDSIETGLKAVRDLATFTAALERAMRSGGGGGSVSSRLFVGETLTDVVVEGAKARGKRRLPGGTLEEIAFVRKKGDWYIRIPKPRV
jgi:hypothetical protein